MAAFEQLPLPDNYYKNYKEIETEDFIDEYKIEKPMGGQTMGGINLCISGTMSECSAANIEKTKEKLNTQKGCKFFEKARFANRCMYEVYESFCWNTSAQRAVKGI
jgi:hypothetical protein